MEEMTDALDDPRDITFARIWIAEYYLYSKYNIEKFLSIMVDVEERIAELQDESLLCILYLSYRLYYSQIQHNQELSKKYAALAENIFLKLKLENTWEKYMIEGIYYMNYLGSRGGTTKEEIERNITYAEKGRKSLAKIPDDGEDIVQSYNFAVAYWYIQLGKLDQAEEYYLQGMAVGKKYNSKYLAFNLISLGWFYRLKGDILKAHDYCNQALLTAKKYNQEFDIIKALDNIAYCFFQEGKYKEALASHQESLQYKIQTRQPSMILLGYHIIFDYYYEMFRIENNRQFLKKTGEQLLKMEDLKDKLSEDSLSMFLIRHDNALLLKHGSFKEKGQAIEIFKQLLEVESESRYHREVTIHLIDLLFENVVITEDERIVKEIETIMNRLGEYPLLRNPKAVFGYTSQQILLAKYTYYLKNNCVKALEILKHTMEQIKELQLKNLEQKIEKELALLMQKTHYRGSDMKEPVDYAEFREYLQEALDLVKQQPVD
ncbi:MAG: hypothetical protein ACFFB5_17010 [Promethearchaeota archaeon]